MSAVAAVRSFLLAFSRMKQSSRSKKSGLPPGSLVYVGERPAKDTVINISRFNEAKLETTRAGTVAEALISPTDGETVWIDVDGFQNVSILESIGNFFKLHPLVLEDILNTTKRPKFEDYDNYLFVVLKLIHPEKNGKRFSQEQISLVIARNLVLSFQESDRHDAFAGVKARLSNDKGRIRKAGSDYLAYALIDSVVDSYFEVLEQVGENLEQLEQPAINSGSVDVLKKIHQLKHQTLLLRRAVWPMREIMSAMIREESPLLTQQTTLYLRDVYDHVVEVIDILEADRDMAASLMEIYLSGLSNRMNSVIKVLTIITTIFMPLTFIAGIYGMNFKHMPELEWYYGYPVVLAVMAAVALSMLIFFRRKGWM